MDGKVGVEIGVVQTSNLSARRLHCEILRSIRSSRSRGSLLASESILARPALLKSYGVGGSSKAGELICRA